MVGAPMQCGHEATGNGQNGDEAFAGWVHRRRAPVELSLLCAWMPLVWRAVCCLFVRRLTCGGGLWLLSLLLRVGVSIFIHLCRHLSRLTRRPILRPISDRRRGTVADPV